MYQNQGGYPPEGYPPQGGYPPQPGFQAAYGGAGNGDPAGYAPAAGSMIEGGEVKVFDFTKQSIRKACIGKVYAFFLCQLLLVFGFIVLFVYNEPTRTWAQNNSWLFWVNLVMVFVCLTSMCCCGSKNFAILGLFTVAEGFLLGITSVVYQTSAVMMAVGITAAVCLAVRLFVLQTKWDFTTMRGILLCATVVLLLFGIMAIFVRNQILTLVYASIGALLFSVYLVNDTHLVLGGKHKYTIFIYILNIINEAKN